MIRIIIIFLFALISVSAAAQSQLSTKNKKAIELYTEADNYRVRIQYAEAIDLLNQAIDRDKNFVEAYYRLGLVYFSMKQFPVAIEKFNKGLSLTSDVAKQKIFWYDMGETYLMMGDYDNASVMLTNFLNVETQNKRRIDAAKKMLMNVRFAKENKEKAALYKLHPLSDTVNCFAMQYFPVLTADQQELIFTRRLGNDMNTDDEDIVISRKNSNGQWGPPVSISDKINSKFNEGTCTVSADGRRLIFTSCVGRKGYGSCDLFETERIGDQWTEPKNLGPNVNSVEWESQPSLSADGRTLYYVTDRRGGFGRRDIMISQLSEDGVWMKAVNAGRQINTEYDEISPFIHVNNKTLYYASSGLPGFGGYDIYSVEKTDKNVWSKPVNVGAPINDHNDQFSLFITADGMKGYYVHEEMSKAGYPAGKIFEMEIPEQLRIKFKSNYVKGIVRDKQTREVLKSQIELININTNEVESRVQSDSLSGEYLIVLTQGAEYALYVNKKGYLFQSLSFNYSEVDNFEPIVLDIDLEKVKEGSVAVLKNIFFDVDKYDLQEKSLTELQKILKFMNDNPAVRIEISGHTDNSGNASYNQQLSDKRAQSVKSYLVEKGIDTRRLFTKGYGSEKSIRPNDTEENKQLNRRIEFKILK